MDRLELQRLRDLPIEGVAKRLGLQVTRHKCLCPFHEDHHPSMSFSIRRNTYRCFVCGEHGGTIDLVMKHLRKDFREACEWLDPLLTSPRGGKYPDMTSQGERGSYFGELSSSPLGRSGGGSFDASRYERFFERPWLNDEARRFLFDERKLDPRVVHWCRLTSWKDRQGTPWLQIPYYDMEGKLIGVQNRRLTPSKSPQGETCGIASSPPLWGGREGVAPRFKFPAGSRCGIYNLPVLKMMKPGEELWITEGCSDCWAMLSSGHKAIAIPSATLLKEKDIEPLRNLNLHMFPDQDKPGEKLFLELRERLPQLVHHQLPSGFKDFGAWYAANKRLS